MEPYRAAASEGNTLEFHLSATRDAQAVRRFFAKALGASHTVTPRVITVDKNAASPKALKELKTAGVLPVACELRQSKYMNNLIEQGHRFIKRLVKPGLGFFSFETARKTLQGYEAMNMIRKGQVQGVNRGDRPEPGSVHRRTVRSGHLNAIEERRSSVLCGLLRVFATQPSANQRQ
jgi:transposase, IS6 family